MENSSAPSAPSRRFAPIGAPGWTGWLLGCALVGGAAWLVFPGLVLVLNDDFGYLRSILHTLEHGRPWTDDWLEPWAASLAGLSALVFRITGSFSAATQGVQAVAFAAAWFFGGRLLRRREVPAWAAAVLALLGLTFPTILFKAFEYGSMVLSLPCLLAAVWLAERRNWAAFFAVWLLAVSTRQSAVAWLALPAWAAFSAWRARDGRDPLAWRRPAFVVVAGIAAYAGLAAVMNETYAQRVMTGAMWSQWNWTGAGRVLAQAAAVFALGAGLAGLVQGFVWTAAVAVPARPWFRGVRNVAVMILALFLFLDPRTLLGLEHSLFNGPAGQRYLWAIGALAAAGWWRGRFQFRTELVIAAAAAALLVSLRSAVWDYYLADVALLAALSVVPASGLAASAAGRPRWVWAERAAVAVLVVVPAVWHAGFVRDLKRLFDGQAAVVALCESSLRAGRITPAQLSLAPFGFQGWHLYPHFVEHEGARGAFIAEFTGYVAPGSLNIATADPGPPPWDVGAVSVAPVSAEPLLASGVFSWEWRQRVRFRLERGASPAPPRADLRASAFRLQRFPLNDAEWRALAGLGDP